MECVDLVKEKFHILICHEIFGLIDLDCESSVFTTRIYISLYFCMIIIINILKNM